MSRFLRQYSLSVRTLQVVNGSPSSDGLESAAGQW